MAARPRILVTRSEPGASDTAARLAALGYEPVVEPVFSIERLPAALPAFDALALTSPNGVRIFASLSPLRDTPVFAVGARTAEIARAHGFTNVVSADGDVIALTQLILDRLPKHAALLHAGNAEPSGDMAGALRAAGIDARHVALYRAAPAETAGPQLAAHLAGAAMLDGVLIHSPRGASILAAQIARFSTDAGRNPAWAPRFTIASISQAAQKPVEHLGVRHAIARDPTEDALLRALQDNLPP